MYPLITSPTWNEPEVILISRSFGTQKRVTSSPSKNEYILVRGFILLETNSTFLALQNGTRSLLTVLSPTEVLSQCSVITVLDPCLDSIPVLRVSLIVSSKVVVVLVPNPGLL